MEAPLAQHQHCTLDPLSLPAVWLAPATPGYALSSQDSSCRIIMVKWVIAPTVSYYSAGLNLGRCCVTSAHIYHGGGQKVALQLGDAASQTQISQTPALHERVGCVSKPCWDE